VSYNAALTADDVRVPKARWLPRLLASDGFGSAGVLALTDGLGHAEAHGGGGIAWSGSTWSAGSGVAANVATRGANGVTNGEFTSATTGWTASNAVLTQRDSTVTPGVASGGADVGCLELKDNGAFANANQALTLVVDTWYRASCLARTKSGAVGVGVATFAVGRTTTGGEYVTRSTGAFDAWESKLGVFRATQTGAYATLLSNAGATDDLTYWDAVAVEPLTLASMFASVVSGAADVIADVGVATELCRPAGLVLNLDSAATPANFVVAYLGGVSSRLCVLEKCVAGVYTTLISAAVTYVAGAVLRVVHVGDQYSLYYNGAQVGTTQTVSDVDIISNTLHGLFGPSGMELDNFVLWAAGSGGEYAGLDGLA
jgi:hypothetical protein